MATHTKPETIFMNVVLPRITSQRNCKNEDLAREKLRRRVAKGGFASTKNACSVVTDVEDDMSVELMPFHHLSSLSLIHFVFAMIFLVLPAGSDFQIFLAVDELNCDKDNRRSL